MIAVSGQLHSTNPPHNKKSRNPLSKLSGPPLVLERAAKKLPCFLAALLLIMNYGFNIVVIKVISRHYTKNPVNTYDKNIITYFFQKSDA